MSGPAHLNWVCCMLLATLQGVKTIQIRNVPERTHRTLRSRAAASGMSLSDYALTELEQVAARPAVADLLRRAGSRAGGAPGEAIVAAVRSGRERD